MIGNNYLNSLYAYPDLDTSINQLLELLSTKDKGFLESLYVPLDIGALDDEERHYLTIVSAIIDYHLQRLWPMTFDPLFARQQAVRQLGQLSFPLDYSFIQHLPVNRSGCVHIVAQLNVDISGQHQAGTGQQLFHLVGAKSVHIAKSVDCS